MKPYLWLMSLAWLGLAAPTCPADDKPAAQVYEEIEILRHLLKARLAEGAAQAQLSHQNASGEYLLNWAGIETPSGSHVTGVPATAAWLYQGQARPAKAAVDTFLPYTDANPSSLVLWQRALGGIRSPATADTTIEGTYVPGHGLIFTITTTAWPQGLYYVRPQVRTEPPSAWEQARRQLRGEAASIELFLAMQTGPSLKEVLLKVLAENGKHLQSLGAEESVTLVVVYRGSAPAASQTIQTHPTKPAAKDKALKPTPAKTSDQQMMFESYRRLADLHTKQGRLDEARKAIDQMLNLIQDNLKEEELPGKLRQDLLKQALQFYLAFENPTAEDTAKLRKLTDDLTRVRPKIQEVNLTEEKAPAPKLPSRLIITAPKKALLQAGAGKLDAAAFEKAVRVEEVRWEK